MSVSHDWVEALNINQEKLNEWSALAPDGVPLIVWLMQEGHVAPSAYLEWAKEHYQLPLVADEYFKEAFDPSSARDLQVHFDLEWRPWFFPVEAWEGITLVACVAPPAHVPSNARLVLADPNTLQNVWSLLASTVTATGFKAPPIPDFGAPADEQQPPALPDIPEGLTNAGTKPFKLNLDLGDEDLFSGAHAEPAASAPPPMPEIPDGLKADPVPFQLDIPEIPSTPAPTSPVRDLPPPTPQELMSDDLSVVKVPSVAARTEAEKDKAKAKPSKGGKKVSASEQDALVDAAFVKLKKVYQHCFLMKCTETAAKLYRWDSSLSPANGGKNVVIDLAFPTFFRIIHKTQLPYHGYLVDSPAHRDFFAGLNITDLPACVTGIPLRDGNQLVGVLVCVGAEELQKLDVLKKVEEVVAPVVESLTQSWAQAA